MTPATLETLSRPDLEILAFEGELARLQGRTLVGRSTPVPVTPPHVCDHSRCVDRWVFLVGLIGVFLVAVGCILDVAGTIEWFLP